MSDTGGCGCVHKTPPFTDPVLGVGSRTRSVMFTKFIRYGMVHVRWRVSDFMAYFLLRADRREHRWRSGSRSRLATAS